MSTHGKRLAGVLLLLHAGLHCAATLAEASQPAKTCAETIAEQPLDSLFEDIRRRLGTLRPNLHPDGRLSGGQKGGESPLPACVVFLTTSSGSQGITTIGRGSSPSTALEQAFLEQPRSLPSWLRLDVVSSLDDRAVGAAPGALGDARGVGLVGLASSAAFEVALHPEEILGLALTDSTGGLQPERLDDFFSSRPHRLDSGRRPDSFTVRFRLRSFFDSRSTPGVMELARGNPARPQWRGDDAARHLEQAAIAAGQFLLRQLRPNGSLVYNYRPKVDRESDDYNILRHAGTTYALFELARRTGAAEWVEGAESGLRFLQEHVRPCPFARQALCVVEKGEIKLGGNALAILALLEHPDIERRPELIDRARALATGILELQQSDGRFWPHKLGYPSGEADDHVSTYYPGEAIFALARLSERSGDPLWLAAARRAARYLIEVRDGQLSEAELPHDHWLAYGLREIHRVDGRLPTSWVAYLVSMSNAIQASQNRLPRGLPYEDWHGGFYEPPRSAPTSTRLEGLVAIGDIADQLDSLSPTALGDTACAATDFLLTTNFRPANAIFLVKPSRVLGAFRRSLTAYQTRIDTSQHAISALLGLARQIRRQTLTCSS